MSIPTKLLTLLLLLLTGTVAADSGEPKWEFLTEKDGIHVWKRELPGSDMPSFRGQTFMKASIEDIMKVMVDVKRHADWIYGCKESAMLELNGDRAIMYNRTAAPWPVWDRDVIFETLVQQAQDKRSLVMNFNRIDAPLRPVPNKVIRLPRFEGFFKLWEIEPKKTKILYQVESDPGGSLPRWLAIMGAKSLPYETLNRLRKLVEVPAASG